MQKYPKLNIFIDISERIPDFKNEEADLAVGFSLVAPENSVFQRPAWLAHAMSCVLHENILKNMASQKHWRILYIIAILGIEARDEVCSTHLKPGYEIKLQPYAST